MHEVSHILRENSTKILLNRILLSNFILFLGMTSEGNKDTREATKMTNLTRLNHRRCMPIEFDERDNAIGEGAAQFASYVGMLIRTSPCVF